MEHLLWVREWDLWGDLTTKIGVGYFDRLRRSYGIDQNLEERPALLMEVGDLQAIAAFSMFPALFGWDAYLIPDARDHFAFVSHEEYAWVIARSTAAQDLVMIRLKDWGATVGPIPCWA
jgi:hypothetical protein